MFLCNTIYTKISICNLRFYKAINWLYDKNHIVSSDSSLFMEFVISINEK